MSVQLIRRSPSKAFLAASAAVLVSALVTPMQDPPRQTHLLSEHATTQRGAIWSSDGLQLAVSDDGVRKYPLGPLVATVTGYTSPYLGADSAEAAFDEVLSGSMPAQLIAGYLDGGERSRPIDDIVLTIDVGLQSVAASALGRFEGAVVALDPRSGAVSVLYANPSYDPNGIAAQSFRAASDAKLDADEALLNHAFGSRAFPGSTGKLVTMLAGLRSGEYDLQSSFEPLQSWLPDGGDIAVDNYRSQWCGGTMTDVFARSCNVSFAEMASDVGAEAMHQTAVRLGFGEPVPFDLPGVVPSSFPEPEVLEPDLLARVGFGAYEVQTNPLHLAVITGAIANGGVAMRPHVLGAVGDPGTGESSGTAQEWRRLMGRDEARIMSELMASVVEIGTARSSLQTPCASVAAKTGTGAFGENEERRHLWVTGFAPVENPQIAFVVFLADSPESRGGTGGSLAGPIARAVVEAALCGTG